MDTNGIFDLISVCWCHHLSKLLLALLSAGDSQPRREYSEINEISICMNTMSISILQILIFRRLRLSIC